MAADRWLVRMGCAVMLAALASPALAAPFCLQNQIIPPQCIYYDANECQHDAMRQGGVCAAACLYALDHNVERLAEDHSNARALARGMAQIPGIEVEHPETNLVFFDTKGTGMTAAAFAGKLRREGVLVSTSDTYRARACLHLDVSAAQVEEALSIMRQAVNR